jgi:hypothetical protein
MARRREKFKRNDEDRKAREARGDPIWTDNAWVGALVLSFVVTFGLVWLIRLSGWLFAVLLVPAIILDALIVYQFIRLGRLILDIRSAWKTRGFGMSNAELSRIVDLMHRERLIEGGRTAQEGIRMILTEWMERAENVPYQVQKLLRYEADDREISLNALVIEILSEAAEKIKAAKAKGGEA